MPTTPLSPPQPADPKSAWLGESGAVEGQTSAALSPFMSILDGFAAATSRLASEMQDSPRYRCDECGAVRLNYGEGEPPASLACWAEHCGIICTGRAIRENATAGACADLRQWQQERRAS